MTTVAPIPVAVFLTSFDPGGTERQMTELVRRLDRRRFEVRVACFHRQGVWLPRVEEAAVEVAHFPILNFRSPSTLARLSAFARWCRARRIAVLQAADVYANAFALPAAAFAGVPVRIGSRRDHRSRGRGLDLLQRLGYRSAHRIVANSAVGAERLQREGIAPHRVSVVRNGLDIAAFASPRSSATRHRIISVARLRVEKAHHVLFDAVARLRPRWPDLEVRLVGDGPLEEELRRLVSDRGLADCVTFLGHREDVPALLADADVFALTSISEASPNAVLEAMAAGLPVVATDVGGIPEAVTSGVNGLLVPAGDGEALARALASLFEDPAAAARLGAAARAHVEAHYSFDHMVGAFEDVYLSELARRGYLPVAPGVNAGGLQPAAPRL